MGKKPLKFIDETIREGMQHRGIVFSRTQKETILDFQEALGVDICQAGYPPAHPSEEDHVRALNLRAAKRGYRIRVAAMGRALNRDITKLISTGIKDFHLHAHPGKETSEEAQNHALEAIITAAASVRKGCFGATISLAVLDIGKTPRNLLESLVKKLIQNPAPEILSLPDTSGILAPNIIGEILRPLAESAQGTKTSLAVHCHNDMGMAAANTLMGVEAGARVVEASALGLGERNGIADLFTVGNFLGTQGHGMHLKFDDKKTFRDYYEFVNRICRDQTGEALLTYNTPFFGEALKTHVAGTHGNTAFGIEKDERFFLNTLCGKPLVAKYLAAHNIPHDPTWLSNITRTVKDESARLGRSLLEKEIRTIARNQPKTNEA